MSGNDPTNGDGSAPPMDDPEELIEPAGAPGSVVVDWEAELTPTPGVSQQEPPPVPAEALEQPAAPAQEPAPDEQPGVFEGLVAEAAEAEEEAAAEEEEVSEQVRRRMTPTPRMVVAVASGKGGVGKSLLAASISIYLAQLGKRVALVDAALSSPNLHTLLGMEQPRNSLHSFLQGEVEHLEDLLEETPFPGLQLVAGHLNGYASANARPTQKNLLLSQIRTLPAEVVVLDLDAGTSFNVIDLFLVADLHVVVTHPEPPSVESTFRMIKSAFIRKAGGLPGVKELVQELAPGAHAGLPTPNQLLQVARQRDPALAEVIYQAMASFKPRLVVNKTRTRDDLELGQDLTVAGRRHVGLPLDYLGYVENDDLAWVTVRKRRPLIVEYPEAKVSKDLERVVRRILSLETKERPECMRVPKPLADQNHYEILGLHPHATEEEVRRAQRRIRAIYGHESRAIFGVAPPEEVEQMHRRIEEAHATLVDPEKRHEYNQVLFPGGKGLEHAAESDDGMAPVTEGIIAPAKPPPMQDLPPMPEIHEETEFDGDLLRRVRQARGLELDDISDRTKISRTYLRAIEEEEYGALPAAVYLRGFIKSTAKELKLDPVQVAESYMGRYEAGEE